MAGPAAPAAAAAARAVGARVAGAASSGPLPRTGYGGAITEELSDFGEMVIKLGFVVAAGTLILIGIVFGSGSISTTAATYAGPTPNSPVPAALQPVFVIAGTALDVNPYLLASVADQESSFGSKASMTVNSAGCVGFMQTCIGGRGGDSWDSTVTLTAQPKMTLAQRFAYKLAARPAGYPDESATHPSYNDPFDAVMAGAVELRGKVSGQPIPNLDGTAHQALCGYYGACADSSANYAQTVLTRAQQWQAENALGTAASTTTPILTASGTGLGAGIVQAAMREQGVLYQWAGGDRNGPTYGVLEGGIDSTHDLGFDCSGLVLYAVYQATGGRVLLPHNAAAQYDSPLVTHVSQSQLQPGDLVFFDDLGHVGIYVGSGEMVDAPQTWIKPGVRGRVELDSITTGFFHASYYGAARVKQPGAVT